MPSLKWKVGKVEIFQIVELEAGPLIQSIIENATPENIRKLSWLCPHFSDESGNLNALVQSFLLKSDNKNILIDTCNGNDKARTDVPEWGDLKTNFLSKLSTIEVNEDDVDVVACTHLHMDHVGWNTKLESGAWVPTFANAKYLFAKQEYEYWIQKPEKEIPDDKAAFDDSVSPIIKADLAELVDLDYKIDQNIRFIPTPGHTPSHVSILIESENHRAIISGDFLHHPCQIANPQWSTEADTFPEKAIETRQEILDQIADTDTLLIGTHFADPVVGRVVRLPDGLIFEI